MNLVNYIVKIIVSFIKDIWYKIEITTLEEELNKEKEKADEAKKISDNSVSEFKLRLQQYRKRGNPDLRSAVKRMRDSDRSPGRDSKDSSDGNEETARSDKGSTSES